MRSGNQSAGRIAARSGQSGYDELWKILDLGTTEDRRNRNMRATPDA